MPRSGSGFQFNDSDNGWTNTNANGRAQHCNVVFKAAQTLALARKRLNELRALVVLYVRRRPYKQARQNNETIN